MLRTLKRKGSELTDRSLASGAPGGTRTPNPFLRTELLFH